MQIFISKVAAEDIDNWGEEGLVGPNDDGEYFDQYVEFGTNPGGLEEVVIGDGCGRSVPVCVESLPELIVALVEIYNTSALITHVDNIKNVVQKDWITNVKNDRVVTRPESVAQAIRDIVSL